MKGIRTLLIAALIFPGVAGTARAVTFGETGTGDYTAFLSYGRYRGVQFVCGAAGSVNRIFIYLTNVGTNDSGMVAIYANQAVNTPGALLNQSASQILTTGWNEFVIPSTSVANGTTYWLALQSDDTGSEVYIRYYDDGDSYKMVAHNITYGTFLNPFGSRDANSNYRLCIYASEILPTPTFTPTTTPTFTVTPTVTVTSTRTGTPTPTPTITETFTVTSTRTSTPTFTESPTATESATDTATFTATPTYTATPTATESATDTATFTVTPTHTATATATESATSTATPTNTFTDTVTATATESATPTVTFTQTPTFTATATATETPTVTSTTTITETATITPTRTHTPPYTATPSDTITLTFTVTSTPTITGTFTPSVTVSETPTESATHTATFTSTVTPTPTITRTRTASPTVTCSSTVTPTRTASPTITLTSTITPTRTVTVTPTRTFYTATPTHTPNVAADNLDHVIVYPNPYRGDMNLSGRIVFMQLPSQVILRIYTLDGQLVAEFRKNDPGNRLLWDLRNRQGRPVASGPYIYVLKTISEKRTGKIFILR